jgi:transposase
VVTRLNYHVHLIRVMPTKSTIYSNCNPQLLKIFEQAGHPAKVMCVALDYAKAQHTALICNGLGDLIKGAFCIDNTSAGLTELLHHVRACAKAKRMRLEHVFFGGEDYPSFAENFLHQLRQQKFLAVRVNAWEAKRQRDNFQASSDSLDLLGIARCCLNRRAQSVQDLPQAYTNLRIATPDRDKLVRLRTALSNRIHAYVDRLFPGFLSTEKSGLAPFCAVSLDLMEERFSPQQLSRRPKQPFVQWLRRRGVSQPEELAGKLKELAKGVLPPAPEQTGMLQRTLSKLIKLYRGLEESIQMLDREVAYWLARTPGALLTSIGGLGITLAAGWTAELGPPTQWRAVDQLCSYAGIVPRSKQTGGPEKEPVIGSVQQRCNKRLKNVVLQAVERVRQYGPDDLLKTAQELEARGAHTEFALAKRLVRLCKHLAVTGTIYRPKMLLDPATPKETLAAYYQTLWDKLLLKWREKADLKDVFAAENPLGQWRNMARELYALELRLPQQRPTQTGAFTP